MFEWEVFFYFFKNTGNIFCAAAIAVLYGMNQYVSVRISTNLERERT